MPNRTFARRPPGWRGSFGTEANGSIATTCSPGPNSSAACARRRRRYASSPPRRSECIAAQLAGGDAPDRLDRHDPELAVPDRPGPGVLHDRLRDPVGVGVLGDDL